MGSAVPGTVTEREREREREERGEERGEKILGRRETVWEIGGEGWEEMRG